MRLDDTDYVYVLRPATMFAREVILTCGTVLFEAEVEAVCIVARYPGHGLWIGFYDGELEKEPAGTVN